ncbi:hypothetical protein THAOC_01824 [Thalassiosira oceanica]|uniref:PPIase cyclophilin-type domain-containing protein n=1 Tax=Thalassiosira oceanica TaxID=159749 RepID=K0TCF1_THAOC|nr:hypothetical protein THAOC_01824 [Thalassiosira oceanica]|eukprot:EJK76413.1 hypothetical protein THAOC_01824 [Thalassiosira oceanica]
MDIEISPTSTAYKEIRRHRPTPPESEESGRPPCNRPSTDRTGPRAALKSEGGPTNPLVQPPTMSRVRIACPASRPSGRSPGRPVGRACPLDWRDHCCVCSVCYKPRIEPPHTTELRLGAPAAARRPARGVADRRRDNENGCRRCIMKENDGKATRKTILQQLVIALLATSIVVVTVKRFGESNWHASSLRDEHNRADDTESKAAVANLADITAAEREGGNAAAVSPPAPVGDKTLVKFVFSNLDGEVGKEGEVIVRLKPEWAPWGAFRVLPRFVVQLGINGDPSVQKLWRGKFLEDDPVKASNTRGTVTFATAGPGSRTTQIFFNTVNNSRLDNDFVPFGEVESGMDVIDRVYSGYKGTVDQGNLQSLGNMYLKKNFPKLSYIKTAIFISG